MHRQMRKDDGSRENEKTVGGLAHGTRVWVLQGICTRLDSRQGKTDFDDSFVKR